MKKISLFLLVLLSFFIFNNNVYAASGYISMGTPTFCIDYGSSSLGTQCEKPNIGNWWDLPVYIPNNQYVNQDGFPVPVQFNYHWENANMCVGQDIIIEGSIGLLPVGNIDPFGKYRNLTIEFYGNNARGVCNLTNVDNTRYNFTCGGIGGGPIVLLFSSNTYIPNTSYEIGLTKELKVTCDVSNSNVVENNNANAQEIINNQDKNKEELEDYITYIYEEQKKDAESQKEITGGILDNVKSLLSNIINLPSKIWEFMKGGFDAITGALSSLGDRISGFFDTLLNGIINGLKDLFIPSDDFFNNWFNDINTTMSAKLGILYLPFEILDTFNSYIQKCSEGNYIIHIPSIKEPFNNFELIKEQNFNIGEVFNTGAIGTIHNLLLIVVDVILIIGIINLAIKKFNEMFGGTSE